VKGIILAGGTGSRLHPLTMSVSKQLLPIYDKPMIFYPFTTLMLAGITEVLIITRPEDSGLFRRLFEPAETWGMQVEFATQSRPEGIAQAFIIAEQFIGSGPCSLILGDNLFYGHGFSRLLMEAASTTTGATIFSCYTSKPDEYGVVELDEAGRPKSIEEKPLEPKSNQAITGLYFYDNSVVGIAKSLRPSGRGELEISDVNKAYMKRGKLTVKRLGRGHAWFDAGTPDALLDAAQFVQTIEKRQGLKIACPEEIAWHNQWIGDEQFAHLAGNAGNNEYGDYLRGLITNKDHCSGQSSGDPVPVQTGAIK